MTRFQCSPPSNDDDFELLCLHLLRKSRECSNLKRNGRRGHRQHGVDLVGESGTRVIGVQCKLTVTRPITEGQIVSEVEKAERFEPVLAHYIIATSSQRDPYLQRVVLDLSLAHQAGGGFSVELLFWNDLEEDLQFHRDVRDRLYGGVGSEQAETLLTSVSELRRTVEAYADDHRQLAEKLLSEFTQQQSAVRERSELTSEEIASLKDVLTAAIDRVYTVERNAAIFSTVDAIRESGDAAGLLEALVTARREATVQVSELNREIATVAYVTGNAIVAEEALRALLSEFPSDIAALNQLGRVCADQGRWDEAEKVFGHVFAIGEEQEDQSIQTAGLSNLGTAYRSQGRFDEAEESFRRAFQIQKAIGGREEGADILAKIGSVYHLRGNYTQARKYYRRAIKLVRSLHPSKARLALHYLANLYHNIGEFERSERLFRKLLSEADPYDEREMALLFGNLGNTLAAQSKMPEAEEALRKAYEYESRLGNSSGVARNLCNLAMLHYYVDLGEAEMLLTEALDIANRMGDKQLAAVVLGNLAEVLLARAAEGEEDFKRVENIAHQGLTMAQKVGSADLIARKYFTLGRIYLALGMKDEARKWLIPARDSFIRIGLAHMVEATNEMLGNCHS